jgi:hypothetical protein
MREEPEGAERAGGDGSGGGTSGTHRQHGVPAGRAGQVAGENVELETPSARKSQLKIIFGDTIAFRATAGCSVETSDINLRRVRMTCPLLNCVIASRPNTSCVL